MNRTQFLVLLEFNVLILVIIFESVDMISASQTYSVAFWIFKKKKQRNMRS